MSWKDAFERARAAQFVGRTAACARFDALLVHDDIPALLFTGPVGIGKTALLDQLAERARAAGWTPHRIALPLGSDAAVRLPALDAPTVVLVDAAEPALAGHVLAHLLPTLPETARLVVAAPDAPAPVRTDPALRRLVEQHPLGRLSDADADALLAARDVPEPLRPLLVGFAQGHPLALVLAADHALRTDDLAYRPEADVELAAALAARFIAAVPTRDGRAALYAAALVRSLDEPLLAVLLDVADPYAPFEALRALPFVTPALGGLMLDPLVRTVIVADLRWRNPAQHATLHRLARTTYARRLADASETDYNAVLSDYLFLLRDNPIVRPFFRLLMRDDGHLTGGEGAAAQWRVTTAEPVHYPTIEALVARHEGPESAAWAAHWLRAQPGSTHVYLNSDGHVGGLLMALALDLDGPDDAGDPAVARARAYLAQNAPLRPGERATLFRFWMGADTYQDVSPLLALVFADTVRHYLSTPRLAFSFIPFADADAWGLVMAVVGLTRLPEAAFAIGDHSYGVFAQDWRRIPPADWLDRISRFGMKPEPPASARLPRRLLDRDTFANAVRDALRTFTAPEALASNVLLDTRVASSRRPHEAPSDALRRVLREAAAPLASSPRTSKFYRALDATYFDPAPTQEEAADALDVPFSTYRRHLRAGIDAMTETLWRRELGDPEATPAA